MQNSKQGKRLAGGLSQQDDRLLDLYNLDDLFKLSARSILFAVGASGTAGLGTGAQRFVHDLLDGPGAPPALGAATETPIDLRRRARKTGRLRHDVTNIVVGQDVAGTNNHGNAWRTRVDVAQQVGEPGRGCKRKTANLKLFQTGFVSSINSLESI
jgi:hypothetical protein